MTTRLKQIKIENFRSINGSITVSLDAPIVLIHGPNGAGKTSLLSAIEIGLLGHSPTLARVDAGYIQNLPHQSIKPNAKPHPGRIQLEVEIDGAAGFSDLAITNAGIAGPHVLSEAQARFYSERCYLSQSAMGRLLDLYQHREKKADSALTKFVKDLLGLDQLDALIEGLYPAGNVTRFRDGAPLFWGAREDLPKLEHELELLETRVQNLADKSSELVGQLQLEIDRITPGFIFDLTRLTEFGQILGNSSEEAQLQILANTKRTLISIIEQWERAGGAGALPDVGPFETELKQAQLELAAWYKETGSQIDAVVKELHEFFPDLQSLEAASPQTVLAAAVYALDSELRRANNLLEQDLQDTDAVAALDESISKGTQRITDLDKQVGSAADDAAGLAGLLAALQNHVHDDECPVCNRNYQELGNGPLSAHMSTQIAQLVDASGRLQSLVRDKGAMTSAIANAKREKDLIVARRLDEQTLQDVKKKTPRFAEMKLRLERILPGCEAGEILNTRFIAARGRLQSVRTASDDIRSLRHALQGAADSLGVEQLETSESIQAGITRLMAVVEAHELNVQSRLSSKHRAEEFLRTINERQTELSTAGNQADRLRQRVKGLKARKVEADRTIDTAKSLTNRAVEARSALVRRVFNEELNAVWRDLFVRLAPDEPFTPAFEIPNNAGAVEAALKTIHLGGGDGGNPQAMLSAGNLNTAALTLFLSLHLSVHPTLPWLIIDDPVQSMDEVHIAQFAALLRALSKDHDRQIIIAVHEKSLFDYLSLELGPAFLDDRLITVEIGRSSVEETTAPWHPHIYAMDKAVAA